MKVLVKKTEYSRNNNAVARLIQKRFIILEPSGANLHTLNPLATQIWRMLWKPRTIDFLLKRIISEYSVTEDDLKKDLKSFLKKAIKSNLIKES